MISPKSEIDTDHVLEDNRKSSIRVDSTASSVEVQFPNRNTHTSDTEISEAEDTGAVSDDDDLWADTSLLGESSKDLG
jgi:hypothetical protein